MWNHCSSKFIRLKDFKEKEDAPVRYKEYRKRLSTLLKKVINFLLLDFFVKILKIKK